MANTASQTARRRLVAGKTLGLFARLGYEKVSFSDISEATGVPRTALYRYYRSKRDIFDEAIHAITAGIMGEVVLAAAEHRSADFKLRKVCDLVVDRLHEQKEFFLSIFNFVFAMVTAGEEMTDRIALFTDGIKAAMARLIEEGRQDGSFRAGSDAKFQAEIFFALMESVGLKMILGVEKDPSVAHRRLNEAVSMLSADGARAASARRGQKA